MMLYQRQQHRHMMFSQRDCKVYAYTLYQNSNEKLGYRQKLKDTVGNKPEEAKE